MTWQSLHRCGFLHGNRALDRNMRRKIVLSLAVLMLGMYAVGVCHFFISHLADSDGDGQVDCPFCALFLAEAIATVAVALNLLIERIIWISTRRTRYVPFAHSLRCQLRAPPVLAS